MALFTEQLGWAEGEVHSISTKSAHEDLEDLGKHIYFRM